jgi:hypothetical protein
MRIQVYPVLFEEMKSSQPCSRAWAASNTHVVAHRIPRGIYENGESTRYIPKNNWTALGKMMMKWIYSGKKTTQMGVFFYVVSMQQIWKQMISQSIYRYSIFQTNPYWWAVSWYVILLGGRKPRFPRNDKQKGQRPCHLRWMQIPWKTGYIWPFVTPDPT